MLVPENILPPPLDPISVPSLRPWNLSDESEQFGGVRKSVHGTHLQWWAKQNKNIKIDTSRKRQIFIVKSDHILEKGEQYPDPSPNGFLRSLQDVETNILACKLPGNGSQ